MSEAYYDDDNYQDGFDERNRQAGMRLALWQKLLRYTLEYRPALLGLIGCALAVAACEVAFPLLTRQVIDEVGTRGAQARILPYTLAYLGFGLLLAAAVGGFVYCGGWLRTHVSHDIRRDGFANLQRLPFAYYDFRPVGWLMARMTSDCERLSNILAWGMLDLVWGSAMMTGITIAMLVLNPLLGVLVLAVVPVLAFVSVHFQRRILGSAREVRKTNSRITGAFNESIIGVATSKAFVKEADNARRFGGLTQQMYGASVSNAVLAALYLPIIMTLGSLATGLALVAGGWQILGGTLTAGTLVAFLAYTRSFFEPVEVLAMWFAELQMAQASAERILSLIEAEADIRDSGSVQAAIAAWSAKGPVRDRAIDGLPARIERIEFRDIGFAYGEGKPVLRGINLEIRRGESIAIVGSTGSGKSTLVNLLCRFYEPTSGQILFDGIDYRQRSLHWLQSNLGIVLQASHVFSGTIAENIGYARNHASREEIVTAARLAGADAFIREFEHGYDQHVGEGGNQLSAGQKQLISFARAILADPQILVMDEATSSVDTITEQHIQQGMRHLLTGRFSLIIAHRLSTIRNASRILVVERGQIIEQGSHEQLLARDGRYRHLYRQQHLESAAGTQWARGG